VPIIPTSIALPAKKFVAVDASDAVVNDATAVVAVVAFAAVATAIMDVVEIISRVEASTSNGRPMDSAVVLHVVVAGTRIGDVVNANVDCHNDKNVNNSTGILNRYAIVLDGSIIISGILECSDELPLVPWIRCSTEHWAARHIFESVNTSSLKHVRNCEFFSHIQDSFIFEMLKKKNNKNIDETTFDFKSLLCSHSFFAVNQLLHNLSSLMRSANTCI
jgi:hypothetical protein